MQSKRLYYTCFFFLRILWIEPGLSGKPETDREDVLGSDLIGRPVPETQTMWPEQTGPLPPLPFLVSDLMIYTDHGMIFCFEWDILKCSEEMGGKAQFRANSGLDEQHQSSNQVLNVRTVYLQPTKVYQFCIH